MKLERLELKNFRGFYKPFPVDLDSRLLLFYGMNGRGKSTVFSALEWVLFPDETLAELRREVGRSGRAPLTNQFHGKPEDRDGTISLWMAGAKEPIDQVLCDDLATVVPNGHKTTKAVAGHRHRIFFTQRLLRDLMFGQPERRHQRFRQLLGTDGYDALTWALYEWHREIAAKVQRTDAQLVWLEEIYQEQVEQIASLEKLELAPQALSGVVGPRGLVGGAHRAFYEAMQADLTTIDQDLWDKYLSNRKPRTFGAIADLAAEAMRDLDQLRLSSEFFTTRRPEALREDFITSTWPAAWWSFIENLYDKADWDKIFALRSKINEHPAVRGLEGVPTQLGLDDLPGLRQAAPELSDVLDEYGRRIQEARRLTGLIIERVEEYQDKMRAFRNRLHPYVTAAQRLQGLDEGLAILREAKAGSVKSTLARLRIRHQLATHTKALYQTILELVHEEMGARAKGLQSDWNYFYRLISSHTHFQRLTISTDLEAKQDARAQAWQFPPDQWYSLRILASDDEAKATEQPFPMETLLSEGQLNCAMVSLALAVTKTAAAPAVPLKLLALDDPFVSWDDVNMENFFKAVRDLVTDGHTVLLSTCDPRVVTSLHKNMETVPMNPPAVIYTFADWDKLTGPVVERREVESLANAKRQYLSQLPNTIFQAESL